MLLHQLDGFIQVPGQNDCRNNEHNKVVWPRPLTSLKRNWCRTAAGLINQMCQMKNPSVWTEYRVNVIYCLVTLAN